MNNNNLAFSAGVAFGQLAKKQGDICYMPKPSVDEEIQAMAILARNKLIRVCAHAWTMQYNVPFEVVK